MLAEVVIFVRMKVAYKLDIYNSWHSVQGTLTV